MRMARWIAGAGLAASVVGAGFLGTGVVAAASGGTSGTSSTSATAPASSASTGLSAFESDLAAKLGVSLSTLQTALQQTESDQVQQLQSKGVLSATTAQKLDQQIQAGGGLRLLMRLAGGRPSGTPSLLQTASQYLGLPVSQIRTDMKNGQSLNAIANAQAGKSASGLQAALVAAEQSVLQQKVAAGTITATQEQTRLTNFEKRLGTLLSKAGMPQRPEAGWMHRGRDHRWGAWAGWAGGMSSGSSASGAAPTSSSTSGSSSSSGN